MTTPLDIITDALLSLGAVAGGEAPEPQQATDSFRFLNNLLDQLSNERMMLFCVQEVIHELTPAQYIYTIGPGGQVSASFTASITNSVMNVTALSSGALSVGQTIQGTAAATGSVTGVDILQGSNFTVQGAIALSGDGSGATGIIYLAALPTIAPFASGTSYKAGQLLTAIGGTFLVPLTVRVASVDGSGGVLSVVVENAGQYTAVINGNVNVSGGTGTGCSLGMATNWAEGPVVITNPGFGYTKCTATVTSPGSFPGTAAVILGGSVNTGTAITSYGTGLGGNNLQALGTYNINIPQTILSSSLQSYAQRPLRINSAFVRIPSSSGNLDYIVNPINLEQYEMIGLKQLSGPWPRAVYYQPSEPLGVLNYWPNPSQGEMHLMCDMLLNRFQTLQDNIVLPQGYAMALMWMLAEILMPQYPSTAAAQETRALIPEFASRGRALIKRTNMQPLQQVRFDTILNSARTQDASFILHGGFSQN